VIFVSRRVARCRATQLEKILFFASHGIGRHGQQYFIVCASIHSFNVESFSGPLAERQPRGLVRPGHPDPLHVPDELREVSHGRPDLQIPGTDVMIF
jgi:hypothetical protein